MDAFFASVEQRDRPELRGKPVAVGFDGPRGVVAAASYEARKFGVRSAMAMATAKRRCPDLIVVDSDHHHYSEVSAEVHRIFHDYTDLVEPLSLDEAFLDVTENKKNMSLAVDIANEIRRRIKDELHLTASAGVSYNKFLAKIASDERKPDGIFVIHPSQALDFIARLPVGKFWSVGPKTRERMYKAGIFTGRDLRKVSRTHLQEMFGKMGTVYYDFARGIDDRPVDPSWVRKSVGCERTFPEDMTQTSQMIIELYHITLELVERIRKSEFKGKTLTLKVKYADFQQITRSMTTAEYLVSKEDILPLAKRLLNKVDFSASHPVRLVGLSVNNPYAENEITAAEPRWIQGRLDFGDDFWKAYEK